MNNQIDKQIFGKRLKQLMKNYSETTYSLSQQFKLSPPSISRYTRGDMAPKMTTIRAMAEYFDVNPEWLMGLPVSMYNTEILNEDEQDSSHFDISVFDEIRYDRPIFSYQKTDQQLSLPIDKLSEWGSVFGLVIKDDVMAPDLKTTDLVAIQLNPKITEGRLIAFHANEKPMQIRKVHLDGAFFITQPLNSEYNSDVYHIKKDSVQIIGRVVYRLRHEEQYYSLT